MFFLLILYHYVYWDLFIFSFVIYLYFNILFILFHYLYCYLFLFPFGLTVYQSVNQSHDSHVTKPSAVFVYWGLQVFDVKVI